MVIWHFSSNLASIHHEGVTTYEEAVTPADASLDPFFSRESSCVANILKRPMETTLLQSELQIT